MIYRPEIDGLRTVAVLPVLFFHAGFDLFSGGYVGVDVFFVISGYLITGILVEDYYQGRFSVLNFYERRARRILPALLLVILVTIPFAWAWMLPNQLKDFSQSLVAVVVFSSNFLFWKEEGYFAAAAELKPLLHTWSLAVEEQYYLIFPVFLIALLRRGIRTTSCALFGVALFSFLLSEWGWRHFPEANFYLSPTRFWELLTGSLCAIFLRTRGNQPSNFLAFVGVVLIGVSVFFYDASVPFPSVYTLAPVIGAALIILYGSPATAVGRILSMRVFVGIGLISYSTYLWHQPLFAMARLRLIHEPPPWFMLLLVITSLVLAYLTWRFVEQPVRKHRFKLIRARSRLFAASAIVGGLLIVFGIFGHITVGWGELRSRSVDLYAVAEPLKRNIGLNPNCDGYSSYSSDCYTSSSPEVLLWGDSFAMHLVQGLLASEPDLALQQHTMSVCSPVLGLAILRDGWSQEWSRSCINFNQNVFEWLKTSGSVKYVILSSPMDIIHRPFIMDDGTAQSGGHNTDIVFEEVLRTVSMIRALGIKVVFVSPTPRPSHNIGLCSVKSKMYGRHESICDFPTEEISNSRELEFMDRLQSKVPVIRLDKKICDGNICDVIWDGISLYRDTGHLSPNGSAKLGIEMDLMNLIRDVSR